MGKPRFTTSRLWVVTSDPSVVAGDMWFNSTANRVAYCDNSVVRYLATEGYVDSWRAINALNANQAFSNTANTLILSVALGVGSWAFRCRGAYTLASATATSTRMAFTGTSTSGLIYRRTSDAGSVTGISPQTMGSDTTTSTTTPMSIEYDGQITVTVAGNLELRVTASASGAHSFLRGTNIQAERY